MNKLHKTLLCIFSTMTFIRYTLEQLNPNNKEELFSINLYGSKVYSSAGDESNDPYYTIDEDFILDQPTCFKTGQQQYPPDGYEWLLIDFGIVLRNVREVRLAADPSDKSFSTKLSNIEIFIVSVSNSTSITRLLEIETNPSFTLPWESSEFQACESTTEVVAGTRVANVKCPVNTHGRWLALRRKNGDLNICLVSVYVTKAYEECFDSFKISNQIDRPKLSGQAFSFIRHLSKSACRAACNKANSCQAIRYKRKGRTGVCEQIRDVRTFNEQENTMDLEEPLLNCNTDNCVLELNYCHLGVLHKLSRYIDSEDNETMKALKYPLGAGISQLWELGAAKDSSTILNSIHITGTIDCKSVNCGPMEVYSIDSNNETELCGQINWRLVSQLGKFHLFCDPTRSIKHPVRLKLNWQSSTGSIVQLDITEINARLINTKLSKLIQKTFDNPIGNIVVLGGNLSNEVSTTNADMSDYLAATRAMKMITTETLNRTDINDDKNDGNSENHSKIEKYIRNKADKYVDVKEQGPEIMTIGKIAPESKQLNKTEINDLPKLGSSKHVSTTPKRYSSHESFVLEAHDTRNELNDDPSQHNTAEEGISLASKSTSMNLSSTISKPYFLHCTGIIFTVNFLLHYFILSN